MTFTELLPTMILGLITIILLNKVHRMSNILNNLSVSHVVLMAAVENMLKEQEEADKQMAMEFDNVRYH